MLDVYVLVVPWSEFPIVISYPHYPEGREGTRLAAARSASVGSNIESEREKAGGRPLSQQSLLACGHPLTIPTHYWR
jgi:hypothetical protein